MKIEPQNYNKLSQDERRELRQRYSMAQKGKCCHCEQPLGKEPPENILRLKIDHSLFPDGFFKYPVHLHHCHDTEMTIGAVHAVCNAVLWQYHGE